MPLVYLSLSGLQNYYAWYWQHFLWKQEAHQYLQQFHSKKISTYSLRRLQSVMELFLDVLATFKSLVEILYHGTKLWMGNACRYHLLENQQWFHLVQVPRNNPRNNLSSIKFSNSEEQGSHRGWRFYVFFGNRAQGWAGIRSMNCFNLYEPLRSHWTIK